MPKATIENSQFFNPDTLDRLNESLAKDDVKTRDGLGDQKFSYIPAYFAIAEANRIFGFGNWSTEIMFIKQVDKTQYEKPPYNAGDQPKSMVSISYSCHLKLTINNGARTVSHEDCGFGNGVAGDTAYGISSCIELATKEAVTDSLKRCLRYYGNKFGLTLYDKDNAPMELTEIEAAKIVSEAQLELLRDLYEPREIGDDWVLAALKAEHYPLDTLETMRFDWYQLAFNIAHKYKLEEIEQEAYDKDIEKVIDMMGKAANLPMLKGLFKEVWRKTEKYKDKTRQKKAKEIYDTVKATFEVPTQ